MPNDLVLAMGEITVQRNAKHVVADVIIIAFPERL
jgi:hypothetical protein